MNLCIDQGNSTTKIGVFKRDKLIYSEKTQRPDFEKIKSIFQHYPIQNTILSSVVHVVDELEFYLKNTSKQYVFLNHQTALPIENHYKTPETLGNDRLAAIVGAIALQPNIDLLVIDAGTAITYDFIDASGIYLGGNIAPGIRLRAQSLHEYTQKLPLVEIVDNVSFMGNDTCSAIQSGILYGIVFEIDGYIEQLMLKYPKLSVFLTGGSSIYFENKLKYRIFANENLVTIGLNRILQYNVQ